MRIKVSKLIDMLLDSNRDNEIEVFYPEKDFAKEIEDLINKELVSQVILYRHVDESNNEQDYSINNALIVHDDVNQEKKLLLF